MTSFLPLKISPPCTFLEATSTFYCVSLYGKAQGSHLGPLPLPLPIFTTSPLFVWNDAYWPRLQNDGPFTGYIHIGQLIGLISRYSCFDLDLGLASCFGVVVGVIWSRGCGLIGRFGGTDG